MSADKPVRKTRNSRKHLATDYNWQHLPDVEFSTGDYFLCEPEGDTANPPLLWPSKQAAQLFAFPPPGEDLLQDNNTQMKSKKDAKAAKTKPELKEQRQSPKKPTLDDSSGDLKRLALVKETHELEIRKLELQLELAKIASASSPSVQATKTSDKTTKSMGDLKAPQRTRFPQPWPHIFAPGEPQLYSELSLPVFCAGYIAIMQQHKGQQELNEAFLDHFHDLMVLASSYKWSAVRAYHYKVLRSIELGLVKWGDSFESLKQPFFIPSALLSDTPRDKEAKQPPKPSSSIAGPTSATLGRGTTIAPAPPALNNTFASSANEPIIALSPVPKGNSPCLLDDRRPPLGTD